MAQIIEFGKGMFLGGKPGATGVPEKTPIWNTLPNCASAGLGAETIWCSNDSFAAVSNLIKDTPPHWDSELMTDQGKWMDGWETKRHNKLVYDTAIISLVPNCECFLYGILVDTSHFSGNHAPAITLEAARIEPTNFKQLSALTKLETHYGANQQKEASIEWVTLVEEKTCVGCYQNFFETEKKHQQSGFTHLRLKMFPDGGIARLKAFGVMKSSVISRLESHPEMQPAFSTISNMFDLALLTSGTLVVHSTNSHFSPSHNMLKPDNPSSMKDGWETRRSRGVGHTESSVLQLGCPGTISCFVVEERFFVNNSPDFVQIEGLYLSLQKMEKYLPKGEGQFEGCKYTLGHDLKDEAWVDIIPKSAVTPNRKNYFSVSDFHKESDFQEKVWTHLRVTMYPDGGIARFRAFGTLTLGANKN